MKPLRTIAIVAAVVALLVVLYKVYLPHKVEKSLDEIIAQVQPFAHITYRNAQTDFSGKLHVTDVTISPTDGETVVNIGLLTLDFASPTVMANALIAGFKEFPKTLSLRGSEIVVDNLPASALTEHAAWPKACGAVPVVVLIGDDDHPVESSIGWLQNEDGGLELDIEYNIADIYRNWVRLTVNGVNLESPALSVPSFGDLALEIADEGYVQLATDKCMAYAGVEAEVAHDWLIQAWVNDMSASKEWAPNAATLKALQTYYKEPESITLRSRSSKPLELEDFQGSSIDPNSMIRRLSLTMEVNGETVRGFGLQPYVAKKKVDGSPQDPNFDNEPGRIERKSLLIGFSQLKKYKGYTVELTASDGETHKGRVLVEENNRIGIQKRFDGGKWTYYPAPSTTRRIEVLY